MLVFHWAFWLRWVSETKSRATEWMHSTKEVINCCKLHIHPSAVPRHAGAVEHSCVEFPASGESTHADCALYIHDGSVVLDWFLPTPIGVLCVLK